MTATLYSHPLRLSVHDLSSHEALRALELEWHGAERRLRLVDEDDPSDVICEAIAPDIRVENGTIDWNDRWLVVSGWQHPTQQAAAFYACVQADIRASQDDADAELNDACNDVRATVLPAEVRRDDPTDTSVAPSMRASSQKKCADASLEAIAWQYRLLRTTPTTPTESPAAHEEPFVPTGTTARRVQTAIGHPLHFGFST